MVIVTQNQYLLASKIHHITLDEVVEYPDIKMPNGRHVSLKDTHYVIQIIYAPENVSNNNGQLRQQDEFRECSVTIRTSLNAHKVFKDLVEQIREQMPDQLFLDKALERMITNMDIATLTEKDEDDKATEYRFITKEKKRVVRKPKKVRRSRKAKRGSKAVLRKSK